MTPAIQSSSTPELPLPSLARLATASAIALAAAGLLLVLVVLPAEYNIDITGFGAWMELTRLSDPNPVAESEAAASDEAHAGERTDRVVVEVPFLTGVEYKFSLRKGEKMEYSWKADSGPLHFDFHGEPEGAEPGVFESYAIASASEARGTFTAPFDGIHGWYWKHGDSSTVRVTLVTSGSYAVVGLK